MLKELNKELNEIKEELEEAQRKANSMIDAIEILTHKEYTREMIQNDLLEICKKIGKIKEKV